jgi:ribosome-associated protein
VWSFVRWCRFRLVTEEVPIDPLDLARALGVAAQDKKATDVTILDLRGRTSFTDAFLLCSARNGKQARAIAEHLRVLAKHELGAPPFGVEGASYGKWVLLDLPGVVVHVFDEATRRFYDLEGLWADAPRIVLPPPPRSPRVDQGDTTNGDGGRSVVAAPPTARDDEDDA